MSKTEFKFEITLLSDMCCGSGTGNGSDVDVVASFDKYGLPRIPGKRLRGLLREKAFEVCADPKKVISLFGESGKPSRLIVDNADIENADAIRAGLSGRLASETKRAFAGKRTNTAIELGTGVAKKGSLRTIEVVKKGSCTFICPVTIIDAQPGDEEIVKNSFKVLRSIGMDKHRGLGEIICKMKSEKKLSTSVPGDVSYEKDDKTVKLDYSLTLKSDIVLMLNSPMQNPDYIPGASVQGALAALFKDEPYFSSLFFDDLKICNAYISDKKETGAGCIPIPYSFVSVKNEPGTAYDLAAGFTRDEAKQYVPVHGYARIASNRMESVSVETSTGYHISRGKTVNSEENFFNIRKIDEGQVFKGSIYCSESASDLLLKAGITSLRIGASLSSQYGLCAFELSKAAAEPEITSLKAGESITLRLLSDTVIIDGSGNNSLRTSDFVASICGNGCFKICKDSDGMDMVYSKTGIVSGYNSKWGMPKQQYYAFEKGSVFVLEAAKNIDNLPAFAGILNSEGSGQIEWVKTGTKEYSIAKSDAGVAAASSDNVCDEAREIINKAEKESTREKVIIAALNAAAKYYNPDLSASAAMRIMTLYQKTGDEITPEWFERMSLRYFKKNDPHSKDLLSELADDLLKAFIDDENKFADEYFGLFIRTFLGRYKEKHRINNIAKEVKPNE